MRTRALIAAVCLAVIAGCGDSRTPAPSLTRTAAPDGFRTLAFPAVGLSFRAPRSWTLVAEKPPLVAVVTSGEAVLALWRYPRTRLLPTTPDELAVARAALIAAAKARSGSVRVIGSRLVRVGNDGAIELEATERIAGQLRRVLSTHLFLDSAEVVLEEYAPPAQFGRLDRSVFSRVRHSLAILPPAPG